VKPIQVDSDHSDKDSKIIKVRSIIIDDDDNEGRVSKKSS
jgi:hypothetical protein